MDHAVVFTWSIQLGDHELFFFATSGLRKEFEVILTIEPNLMPNIHMVFIYILLCIMDFGEKF